MKRPLLLLLLLALAPAARALPPLKLYLALTRPGGTLRLEPGTYAGGVVIDKPITIEGNGRVTIDGGGEGTVIRIRADGVTLRGLHITHSGTSHDQVDAGIEVEGDRALIEDNLIDRTLFGIHLKGANDARIRRNRVFPYADRDISIRGDAIRLWYGHGNRIEANEIAGARDLVFTNASDNLIARNHIHHGRVSMELVYSPDNRILDNRLEHNVTGITVIYSSGLRIEGNRIAHMRKLTGSGIAVKESHDIRIRDNEIAHCAVGLLATSPLQPENILHIEGNLFTYNDLATYFYGEHGGHELHGNAFIDNFVDALGSAPPTSRLNDWTGNYWDRYAGFDQDGDGVGDLPYRVWLHADRIWLERSMARFFRGTPALSLIDFVERLVPYSKPELIYADPKPLMAPPPGISRQPESSPPASSSPRNRPPESPPR